MAKILIADDMAVIREPMALALQREGHETLCAANGNEALAMLRGQIPDLMLLDVYMPEMNGLDLLRRVRDNPTLQSIPVILLTDASDRKVILQARELGVHHYLLKSAFSLDELLRRVNTLLTGCSGLKSPTSPTATPSSDSSDRSHAPSPSGPVSTERPSHTAAPRDSIPPDDSPPKDPNEALKALKPLVTRSHLADRLESCGELKALSPTVTEVLKLCRSATASTEHIAKAIRRDHAIATKILRMANSVAYSSDDPVDSVDKAVVRIGMKAIGQAVLNISVIDHFSSTSDDLEIDPRLFWEHSIGCGIIGARLASAIRSTEPDAAFTLGLIHDIGRLVYSEMLGEQYRAVCCTAEEVQLPLERVEKRLLLLNHADAMDRILHAWGFPRDLIDPIVFHHLSVGNIRRIVPKRLSEVATLALANRLTHALLLGSSGNESIYPTHEFCRVLKVSSHTIQEIVSHVHDETNDLKFAMCSAGGGDSWPDVRERVRQRLGVAFQPVFVSSEPEFDAFRLFCDQLREPSDEDPNIGIIHLSEARDRVRLSNAFRQAETEAGASDLPLVVLSPSGNLMPEESLLANRRYVSLPTPLTLERFLDAVRGALGASVQAKAA